MQIDRKRKYWGWGRIDFEIDDKVLQKTIGMLQMGLGAQSNQPIIPKTVEDLNISIPRFTIPDELLSFCTDVEIIDYFIQINMHLCSAK